MDGIGSNLLLILIALLGLEALWSWLRGRGVYNLKEVGANIGIAIGSNFIRPLSLAWKYFIFSLIEPMQINALPETGWIFLLTFLVVDCAYYWYHRLSHEIPILWTMHHTHHSSLWYNLTTAVRLNWVANFVSPLFFAPLIIIGFSPFWVTASLALGLFYQLFLHTEAVPRLGWFEGKLLNTPSAHRVHHGSNSQYIDKNYAGALIIWDRIFGTYQVEEEKVRYGVTSGFVGHNPFVIQFAPILKYMRGEWLREKELDELGADQTATK
jgi:sterol desaturase/sphingolipid hydroxylase (fatty acid hydroxylase superfamily)